MARGYLSEDKRRDDDDEPDVTIDDVTCVHHTERAILVAIRGVQHWVPQSVVCDESEVFATGHNGKLIVRAWFARKLGQSD